MDGAAADVEQVLTRAAGLPVLLDGVAHRLLGEVVLELEGGDGESVDEKPQVEGALFLVVAVPQLAGDGETVLGVAFCRGAVPWRGRTVEEVNVVLVVADAPAEDVDDAAAADFAFQSGRGTDVWWGCRCRA